MSSIFLQNFPSVLDILGVLVLSCAYDIWSPRIRLKVSCVVCVRVRAYLCACVCVYVCVCIREDLRVAMGACSPTVMPARRAPIRMGSSYTQL